MHQTHEMLKIYVVAFAAVCLGMLPDILLRTIPLDARLQRFPASTIVTLQQFLQPFVVSVIIPGIVIVMDKRYRKGFVEAREWLRDWVLSG